MFEIIGMIATWLFGLVFGGLASAATFPDELGGLGALTVWSVGYTIVSLAGASYFIFAH